MKNIHKKALFRISVLGGLASRDKLERGELETTIKAFSKKTYNIPDSIRKGIKPKTIQSWYYKWKKGGVEALEPKIRKDKNTSQLAPEIQEALIRLKEEKPSRSINTMIEILTTEQMVVKGKLAKATVHRFLKTKNLSKRTVADAISIERRSFVAQHCGDIWHADVMHGPNIITENGMRKVYLVSFIDDTSRLLAASSFRFGETALDIEVVLKQAILKRGVPKKIILDNGSAYRSESLQSICARLQIRLIYCPAYEPQPKGKIERFHRTFREAFLDEIDLESIHSLDELNSRLWVWIETFYHQKSHDGINKQTPIEIWQRDLKHIDLLGTLAQKIDDIFYHRVKRYVRKNGTVSWNGKMFEVPYELSQKTVYLVIDPHANKTIRVEAEDGTNLGPVTPLDLEANNHRKRQRPIIMKSQKAAQKNLVELKYQQLRKKIELN